MRIYFNMLVLIGLLSSAAACGEPASETDTEATPISRSFSSSTQALTMETETTSATHEIVKLALVEADEKWVSSARIERTTGLVQYETPLGLSTELQDILIDHLQTLPVGLEQALVEAILVTETDETLPTAKRGKRPSCNLGCQLLTCLDSCSKQSGTAYCDAWCSCRVLEGKGILQCQREVHIIDL